MDQIEQQQQLSARKEFYAQQSRRKWTQEEDNICRKVVEDEMNKNGGNIDGIDWSLVEKALNGTRNIRQCKERWRLRLDPNINKEPWTATDDQTLLQLQAQLGNQWITICKRFPGRSDHACKCRWMALMREKKRNGKLRSDSTSILLPPSITNEQQQQQQPTITHSRSSSNPLGSVGGLTNNGSSMSGNSGSASNRGSGSMSISRLSKTRNGNGSGNNGSGTNESDSFPTTSDTSASAQLDGSDPQKSSSLMSGISDIPKEVAQEEVETEDEKSSSSDSGDQSGGSGSGSGSNLESISKRRRLSEDGTITEDLGNDSNVNISNILNHHFSSNNSGSQATAQAQIFSSIGNRKGDHDTNTNINSASNTNNSNNQHSSSAATSGNVSSSSLNSNANGTQVPAFMGVNLGMGNGLNSMLFNGQFMPFPQVQPVSNITQNQQFSLGTAAPMMVVPLSSLPQTQFGNNGNTGPYVLVPATSIVTPLGGINQQLSNSPGYLIPMIAIPGSNIPSTPSANMGMQILQIPGASTANNTNSLSSPHQATLGTSLPGTLGSPTGNGKSQSSTSTAAPTIPFVFPSFSQFTAAAASLANNNNNSNNNHNGNSNNNNSSSSNKRGNSR